MKNKKILYLVDVSAIVFRAFYALPPMQNKEGQSTNALFGFLKVVLKLLKTKAPSTVVFCLDTPHPSFRKKIYSEYKANRKDLDPDLAEQLPFVEGLIKSLGICVASKKGFEADDVIGSLAKDGEKKGYSVAIVSGDKDFAQLINKDICMYDIHREIIYDNKQVLEKWNVKPEQMIDYLALVGDSSDNIPGVRGIGPKGASKLLLEFKTLKNIYDNVEKIASDTVKKKLLEAKKIAFLSQTLVKIDTKVSLPISESDWKLNPINEKAFKAYTEQFAFKNTYTGFMEWQSGGSELNFEEKNVLAPGGEQGFKLIKEKNHLSKASLKTSVKTKVDKSFLAFTKSSITDTIVKKKIKDIFIPKKIKSISVKELKEVLPPYEKAWVFCYESSVFLFFGKHFLKIPFADNLNEQLNLSSEATDSLRDIGEVLESKKIGFKSYDIKNLWTQMGFKKAGITIWDNQLAAHVGTSNNIKSWEGLCFKYLEKDIEIKKDFKNTISAFDILRLHLECEIVFSHFLKLSDTEYIFSQVELPLISVLYDMENRGMLMDKKFLLTQEKQLSEDINKLTKSIYEEAGEEFNIASPKQLGVILFEKLGFPVGKKTKTAYSTASSVLEPLKKHKIVKFILEFRELSKLQSTYVTGLLKRLNKQVYLHTQFNQSVTSTGRLSSSNPNLQNIPIKTARGKLLRKAFVARPSYEFIAADYSQIELRILAHLSGDKNLCKAFINKEDVHAFTASQIFKTPLKKVTKEQRGRAKAVNFGISYGQGVFGLSESLGISRAEASSIIKNYHSRFPLVQEYMESVKEQAHEDIYVKTLLGRRRYLPDLLSSRVNVQKFGERAATNAPMQGTASDLIKLAMVKVASSLDAFLLLQVHDELIIESLIENREDNILELKNIMESVVPLKVPLEVNISCGANWLEC
ncbi:MAG: DNA polymerase I [Bdellovibrionaceae bacterium]|nr:DNA polymerase I [Pseudobdellovibrionaceae bacterium]